MAENKKGAANQKQVASPSKAEVELRKKINELEKTNEDLMKKTAQAEEVTSKPGSTIDPEMMSVIKNLQQEVDRLKNQGPSTIIVDPSKKEKYDPIKPEYWQDDTVIFTARSIMYVVGSYKDSKGVDKLPPHGPIVFEYAASDIRKEGNEEHILNYCQFQTNLKTEIEYLRNHPHYSITFSENVNRMMEDDEMADTQFKVRAASMVNAMSSQALFERSKQYKIPYHGKEVDELKIMIIHELAKEFKEHANTIRDERLKRMAVGNMALQDSK